MAGPKVVIVGAGFAGAATAAALCARGARDIAILEAEPLYGAHASGKNAAMARRIIAEPVTCRMATDGLAGIVALGRRRGVELLRPVGGMVIGDAADVEALEARARAVPELDASTERLTIAEAARRVPALRGASAEAALLSHGCGVVDIHALLSAMLDEARDGGARLWLRRPLTGVRTEGGRVVAALTPTGELPCDVLVLASGFSANRTAAMAGAGPLPFRPVRRHLFTTEALGDVDPGWPFVWNVSAGVYFRPEGRGLLMCACDQTPWPAGAPAVDPGERERLAERFSQHLPALRDARPSRAWACVRYLTPDDRFVIGPDPGVGGLFWVAGLGGHGMTTSAAVGDLAAQGILDGALPGDLAAALSPARFEAS
ncbi:MAG: FAD-binding oxidoreductase [Deltaproteobacteria bacterium]|nr:FAD-binding oxidoreductase [Deltaproteobacteria bacterium]